MIKGHFTLTEEGGPRTHDNGKLRLIQVLFPEHCETDPGKKPQWITPARQGDIAGPTIRATSLDKNTTGTHADLLKIDDGTTAENTQNAERIQSVNRALSMARKLCEPFGYKDRIGTPYHLQDNLTATVKDEEMRAKNGLPPLVKILIHPAYEVLPEFADQTPDLFQPTWLSCGSPNESQ